MINTNMNPISSVIIIIALVFTGSAVVQPELLVAQQPAHQQDQARDQTGDQPQPPPIDYDRGYGTDRRETLSRHQRFDPTGVPPGYSPYTWYREMAATDAYDRGYAEGFRHGWVAAQQTAAEQRNESLVTSLLAEGGQYFRDGEYGAAVRSFMLAAELNQGDPASRLQAAHALTALGRYDEAFLLLRRAFQLQPKLVYLGLDIRRDYIDQGEFRKHIQRLELDATAAGDDPHLWALLGYYRFFSDRRQDAYVALQRAADLDPDERFISRVLNVARLSTPASTSPEPPSRKRD